MRRSRGGWGLNAQDVARALYTSLGFQPCKPYRQIPEVFSPWTICMELALTDA
jgi:hypothetical protein